MIIERLLEQPVVYRAWMTPFVRRKLAPVLAHLDGPVRRVLDVGCGPGTNTEYFPDSDYLGIDINEKYIESARRQTGRSFVVADVREYRVSPEERFDLILVNSLLHHLDTASVGSLLAHLGTLIDEGGHLHCIELVLPERASIPRALALMDRGRYPRPLAEWRELLQESFEPLVFEGFGVGIGMMKLWELVHFKGRPRGR